MVNIKEALHLITGGSGHRVQYCSLVIAGVMGNIKEALHLITGGSGRRVLYYDFDIAVLL